MGFSLGGFLKKHANPLNIMNPLSLGMNAVGLSGLKNAGEAAYNKMGGIGGAYDWLSGNKGSSEADADRALVNPYLQTQSPYINPQGSQVGNHNALISMIRGRAMGQGPSLAEDAYKQASSNTLNNLLTMSHGSTPGAARAAVNQMGNINQGMASGLAQARNQEIVGATGQLGQAINAADNSLLQRERANQDAWLQMMAQRFGLTRQQLGGKSNFEQIGGMGQGIGQMIAML